MFCTLQSRTESGQLALPVPSFGRIGNNDWSHASAPGGEEPTAAAPGQRSVGASPHRSQKPVREARPAASQPARREKPATAAEGRRSRAPAIPAGQRGAASPTARCGAKEHRAGREARRPLSGRGGSRPPARPRRAPAHKPPSRSGAARRGASTGGREGARAVMVSAAAATPLQ